MMQGVKRPLLFQERPFLFIGRRRALPFPTPSLRPNLAGATFAFQRHFEVCWSI